MRLSHLPAPDGAGDRHRGVHTSVPALPQGKIRVFSGRGGKRSSRVRVPPSHRPLTVNRVRASGKLKSGGVGDIFSAARARHRAAAPADDVKREQRDCRLRARLERPVSQEVGPLAAGSYCGESSARRWKAESATPCSVRIRGEP